MQLCIEPPLPRVRLGFASFSASCPGCVPMALPLDVLADLELAVDGEAIDIQGDGKRIVVRLPSLRAGRRLLSSGPFAQNRAQSISRIQQALTIGGFTVDVRLQNNLVARIGADAQPGAVSRLLRLDGVEVRATESVRSVARTRPLWTAGIIAGLVGLIAWIVFRGRSD